MKISVNYEDAIVAEETIEIRTVNEEGPRVECSKEFKFVKETRHYQLSCVVWNSDTVQVKDIEGILCFCS